MSELKVNKISPATGTAFTLGDSGDTFTVPSGATITNSGTATGFGGGKVLQLLQTAKLDSYSQTAEAWTDITGLSIAITPASTSNKIFVMVAINASKAGGGGNGSFRLLRGSTVIGASTVGSTYNGFGMTDQGIESNTMGSKNCQFLDSPSSTSATTYKVQLYNSNTSYASRINQRGSDTGYGAMSSITVMEIGA
mgnify:FL=1